MSTQVLKQGEALKRKIKKWEIALIVIALIIALIGGGALYLFWDVIFSKATDSQFGAFPENFGYFNDIKKYDLYKDYSDHFAQFEEEIQRGMADDATDEEKVLAAYIIYRVACLTNATAPEYAKYTTGGGSATGDLKVNDTTAQVGGSMNMTSTYYTILDPTETPQNVADLYNGKVDKYVAQEEYTQIPKGGITASDEGLVDIGELFINMLLPFARRSIVTPEETITWNGDSKSSKITEENVTAKFDDKKKAFTTKTAEQIAEEAKYNRPYGDDYYDEYGLNAHDISIHIINQETIIPSSVKITENVTNDLKGREVKYYEVEFEVDTETNRGTELSATYYAEQLYIANAPLEFLNNLGGYKLYYSNLKIKMGVFENGYMRTWATDETWIMQADVTAIEKMDISCILTSKNFSEEAYCYEHDTIMQGFVNRWIGDSEFVNKPIEDLPFYDKLADLEKEAYGTYR